MNQKTQPAFQTLAVEPASTTTPRQHNLDPEHWVENHGDCLYRYALGQVRNGGVAEDLVQETFLAALRGQERFCGQSTERTWLVGILRHKIVDHLRLASRSVPMARRCDQGEWETDEDLVLWLHEASADCAAPHRGIELSEFRTALEQAMGDLPPRLAQVFQLYEVEERSAQDVCEKMAISPSNLWVMLHRARHQLRQELSPWWHHSQMLPASAASEAEA